MVEVQLRLVTSDRKTIPFYADAKGKAAEEYILVKSILVVFLTGLRLSSTFDGELSAFNFKYSCNVNISIISYDEPVFNRFF